MAGIIPCISQSGNTIYAFVWDSAGAVWNGSSFETYNALNWLTYALSLTESTSSGYYKASFPSAISSGKYTISIYQQLGGSPAAGDPAIGAANYEWDGTNEVAGAYGALTSLNLDKLAKVTAGATNPATGSWMDKLMNKDGSQTFDPSTDSLEAIRDGGSGGPTASQIADAVWDEVLDGSHAVSSSSGQRVKDIHGKLPTGTISDFDESTNNVNLNASQSGVTIGTVNNLGTTARSQINSEVVDALFTDTLSELASMPGANPTIAQAIMLLFMMIRNKHTATSSEEKIYNNSGAAIAKATVSDSGSTFTKEQYGAP